MLVLHTCVSDGTKALRYQMNYWRRTRWTKLACPWFWAEKMKQFCTKIYFISQKRLNSPWESYYTNIISVSHMTPEKEQELNQTGMVLRLSSRPWRELAKIYIKIEETLNDKTFWKPCQAQCMMKSLPEFRLVSRFQFVFSQGSWLLINRENYCSLKKVQTSYLWWEQWTSYLIYQNLDGVNGFDYAQPK